MIYLIAFLLTTLLDLEWPTWGGLALSLLFLGLSAPAVIRWIDNGNVAFLQRNPHLDNEEQSNDE